MKKVKKMSKRLAARQPDQDEHGFDLVASGSSGPWSVFIDETPGGPERWFAQIKGPQIYFSFEIPSAKTLDELLRFLDCSSVLPLSNLEKRSVRVSLT